MWILAEGAALAKEGRGFAGRGVRCPPRRRKTARGATATDGVRLCLAVSSAYAGDIAPHGHPSDSEGYMAEIPHADERVTLERRVSQLLKAA
jgi:hypothetical protein